MPREDIEGAVEAIDRPTSPALLGARHRQLVVDELDDVIVHSRRATAIYGLPHDLPLDGAKLWEKLFTLKALAVR